MCHVPAAPIRWAAKALEKMSLNPLQSAILSGDVEAARSAARADPTLLDSRTDVGTPIVSLARGTGSATMLVAMLRVANEVPDSIAARKLLNDVMREISHAAACAGWLRDLEFLLWQLFDGGELTEEVDPWGVRALSAEERAELRWLSELAGGGWCFDDASGEVRFVGAAEWRGIHVAWVGWTSS